MSRRRPTITHPDSTGFTNLRQRHGEGTIVTYGPMSVAAAGFNPADYGSSYSWWAARLESFSDGSAVALANDYGANNPLYSGGMPMQEISAGGGPTFIAGTDPNAANGQPLFRFTSGKVLRAPVAGGPGGNNPLCMAVVARLSAIPAASTTLLGGNQPTSGTGVTSIRQMVTTGSVSPFCGNGTTSASFTNGYTYVGWQVIIMTFATDANGAGLDRDQLLIFKDGLTFGPAGSNYLQETMTFRAGATFDITSPTTGCRWQAGGNVDIAESILWYNGLTLAQRIAAGKALADLYGIPY
jgi:hypothetical protein